MVDNSWNRIQTLKDMKDILLRLEATESHIRMFCEKTSLVFIIAAIDNLKMAIKKEEEH